MGGKTGSCAKQCGIRIEDNVPVRKIMPCPGQLTRFERLIRKTPRFPGQKHLKPHFVRKMPLFSGPNGTE